MEGATFDLLIMSNSLYFKVRCEDIECLLDTVFLSSTEFIFDPLLACLMSEGSLITVCQSPLYLDLFMSGLFDKLFPFVTPDISGRMLEFLSMLSS